MTDEHIRLTTWQQPFTSFGRNGSTVSTSETWKCCSRSFRKFYVNLHSRSSASILTFKVLSQGGVKLESIERELKSKSYSSPISVNSTTQLLLTLDMFF